MARHTMDDAIKQRMDAALAKILTHLRDVSLRDGVQSWDGNKWKIADIETVAQELNAFWKKVGDDLHITPPPVEIWGGGQFLQPAKFNAEDPFVNLERLHNAAPDLTFQALLRGRQCLGFKPVSAEIQHEAIKASAKRGIQVFRVFDMMNDIENVKDSIGAINQLKQEGFPKIQAEGAIAYTSEPEGGPRAWTLDDYANYAVELAGLGVDAIAIKDYAGVGAAEMPDLIRTIKKKLAANNYPDMAVNVHSHGQTPEAMVAALDAGAGMVDVAIGDLSGGPSHANMHAVICKMLEARGFKVKDIEAHPIIQQLEQVENAIYRVANRQDISVKNGEPTSFAAKRGPLRNLRQEDIDAYRMAGGALSDLLGRVQEGFPQLVASWARNKINPSIEQVPSTVDALFHRILSDAAVTWEKAGRFNTVTPGAKILVDQQQLLTLNRLNGLPATMGAYTRDFKDVVCGRYGENRGVGKVPGATEFRDALLMYDALEVFNEAVKNGQVRITQARELRAAIGLDSSVNGARRIELNGAQFMLNNPNLEQILMAPPTITNNPTIDRFREALDNSAVGLPPAVANAMCAALTPGRSASPADKLKSSEEMQRELQSMHIDPSSLFNGQKPISDKPTVALLSQLMPPADFKQLVTNLNNGTNVTLAASAVQGVGRSGSGR